MLAVIPVKPFGVAKARLAPVLDATARSRLGRAMARRTAEQIAAAGAEPLFVTSDDGVAAWARNLGFAVAAERGPGLNNAAATGRDAALAAGRRWMVVHADLPLVTARDVAAAIAAMPAGGAAVAPAVDGGTNLIAGSLTIDFAYGVGSFHRHLRSAAMSGPVAVVTRAGLALDLDRPADLARAASHPAGSWLGRFLP